MNRADRAYRVAMFCGAVPLVIGVSIFLLSLLTHWTWLIFAGVITLYGGVAIFLVGIIALARYYWLASHTSDLPRRRVWLSILGGASLLLSNFLVAGGIIAAVIALGTCYTVVVHNTSQQPLDGVRVFGGGCEVDFGAIPPGVTIRRNFWIKQDGQLEFRADIGATTHAKTIDDYVTNNGGGHTTVTANPNGTISVSTNKSARPL